MQTQAQLNLARADFEVAASIASANVATPIANQFRVMTGTQAPLFLASNTGFGLADPVQDGEEIPEDEMTRLPQLTITPLMRGKRFSWTRLGQHQDQYGKVRESATNAGRKLAQTRERDATDALLNDAFTATNFLASGVTLFNDAHNIAGTILDNLSAATALSEASVAEMLTALRRQVDPRGIPMAFAGSMNLIVTPENEFVAAKIKESVAVPGTADNDANVVRSRFNVIVADYADPGSLAYIMVPQNKEEHFLYWYNHLPQEMLEDKDVGGHRQYVCQAAWGFGGLSPYNVRGCQGA